MRFQKISSQKIYRENELQSYGNEVEEKVCCSNNSPYVNILHEMLTKSNGY